MKDGQKFFLGGLGGLAPIIMNLLVLDLAVLLTGLNPLTVVGYVIRVLVLFGVGGFVAWLHTGERNRVKIFEIALGAPGSMVRLLLFNNSLLTINENATLIVDAGQLSGNKKIELLRGGVLVIPEKMKTGEIEIRTPSAVIGTRG